MRFDVRDALAKFAQKARTKPAILNTEPSRIWLAFRADSTAPPQACALIGAAAMPEIDGNRPHTHTVEVGHVGLLFATPSRSTVHGRCQKAGVGKQIQPTRRAAGLGEWDWWRSGPGSHHQQYVQRGTPRTSFADPACGLAATARRRRTNLCSNFAMARAHRPLYRLGTAHLRHPGRPLCRPGTAHPCPVSFTTLRSSERCRDTPA